MAKNDKKKELDVHQSITALLNHDAINQAGVSDALGLANRASLTNKANGREGFTPAQLEALGNLCATLGVIMAEVQEYTTAKLEPKSG